MSLLAKAIRFTLILSCFMYCNEKQQIHKTACLLQDSEQQTTTITQDLPAGGKPYSCYLHVYIARLIAELQSN